MPNLVIFFFLFTTLSVLLSGYFLPRLVPSQAGKRFGNGLLLTGISFGIWSYAVITKPADSAVYSLVSLGLFALLIALLFYISSASTKLPKSTQQLTIGAGIVYAFVLWMVRTAYPSQPGFSESGLFFFNPHEVVKFMQIILIAGALIPATLVIAQEIREKDKLSANIFTISMITTIIGGILLLSSYQDMFLLLDGWAMGIAFLFLLLFSAGLFVQKKTSRS